MVAVPPPTPVTSPVVFTVAIAVLLLLHTPPPVITNAQVGNSGTYNVTVTVTATGCKSSGSGTVIVKPTPAAPTLSANNPCDSFFTLNLTASDAAGSTYSWRGPSGFTSTLQNPAINPAILGLNNGTYTVIATLNGCPSLPATVVASIRPNPAPPVTTDTFYCQFFTGQVPLNYQVDSAAGSALNWFTGATPLSGAPLPSTAASTYPSGTTWNVSQTVNGCTSRTAAVKVTIVPTPQFSVTYRNWVCQFDSIVLSYTTVPGSALISPVFNWSLPFGTKTVGGTHTSDPSVYVAFDSSNVNYYDGTLMIGNLNGQCSTTMPFSVRVIPLPASHAYCKPDICIYDTVSLALTSRSPDATNFFWYIDGNTMSTSSLVNIIAANSNSGGPYSLSWNDTGVHIIAVQCTTNEGCQSFPTFDTIDVHQIPDAGFTFKPKASGTLCLEDSVQFKANDSTCYNCSYLWLPEHAFNNDNKWVIWGKVEESKSDIMLTVTDPFGCTASSVQEIDPNACCTVLFPTAFTPNGDGKNDFYRPLFNGYHRFHQFRIVNRWGQTVFESANSYPEWDGNLGGVPQDMGVYYYYLKYDCGGKTIEQKGDCTLVR